MIDTLPPRIFLFCINNNCPNQICLELDNKYYRNKFYIGECERCGIQIRIDRFSPFVTNAVKTSDSFSTFTPTEIRRSNKPAIKSDL